MMQNRNKKITIFVATLQSGGSERVCVTLANGLVRLGWAVNLVVGTLDNERYLNELAKKINIVCLGLSKPRYSFFSILNYIRIEKPNIIFTFSDEYIPFLVVARKCVANPIKIISRNRSIFSEKKKIRIENKRFWANFVRAPLMKIFYSKVDLVVNQSLAMQNDLLENIPILKGKTIVINNPVSDRIEQYVKYNDVKSFNNKEKYILCVARLSKVKALHFAIIAFASVLKENPDFRLKIIGEGPLEKNLKNLAINLKVIDSIDFEGYQENVAEYYYGATVTILTSLHEGFPNALIESIYCGTPVVSFDSPSGPRELLEAGRWGKLVTFADTEALALAINENIKHPYPADFFLRANDFSSEIILKKYEEILNNL